MMAPVILAAWVLFEWARQRLFWRPTSIESAQDGVMPPGHLTRPSCDGLRLSSECKRPVPWPNNAVSTVSNRSRQRLTHGPSKFHDTHSQCGVFDACNSGPVAQMMRAAVIRIQARIPFIGALLKASRPSAIIRTIRVVIVSTINRVHLGRPRTHVVQECVEALPPLFADRNASGAVIPETDALRVVAAVHHARVNVPQRVSSRSHQLLFHVINSTIISAEPRLS